MGCERRVPLHPELSSHAQRAIWCRPMNCDNADVTRVTAGRFHNGERIYFFLPLSLVMIDKVGTLLKGEAIVPL